MKGSLPITDHEELISKEVECRMRPFITANFEGQERLYQKMDRLEKLVIRGSDVRIHAVVNSVAIVGLFVFMLLVLSSCS
jgi:hypothetical protein